MNELKLRGKVCAVKSYDWGSKFAINFYAGKDKDEKATYGFIDCKAFKMTPKEREIVETSGWLSYEKFSHDGKNYSRLIYVVKEMTPYKAGKMENYSEVEPEPFNDDDLGF